MLKKALTGLDQLCRGYFACLSLPRYRPGLPALRDVPTGKASGSELGEWHYMVADPSGIHPRQEANYKSKDPAKLKRPLGSVVQVSERRRRDTLLLPVSEPGVAGHGGYE